MDRRDEKVIASVSCPECGVKAGQPCRNPVPHQAHRGPEDHRAQPVRPHAARRALWLEWKRGPAHG